jgi:hypothetical protein
MICSKARIGVALLSNNLFRVDGVYAVIRGTLKHDHWHAPPRLAGKATLHSFERDLPLLHRSGPPFFMTASPLETIVTTLNSPPAQTTMPAKRSG